MRKLSLILFALSVSLSLWAQTTTPISSGDPVSCGKTVRLTVTENEGYEFDHWSDISDPTDPDYAKKERDVVVTKALNLTAIFKLKEYTLNPATYMATTGEGTITFEVNGISSNTVKKGDVVKIIATSTDDCREFDYWEGLPTTDPQFHSSTYTFTYDPEDVPTIKAVYKDKVFTVTVTADEAEHGTIEIKIVEL